MKIINLSDRIYDLGSFQVPPGRRGIVVPEGCEEMALKVVKSFAPELEIEEDKASLEAENAKLKAALEAAKAPKRGPKAKKPEAEVEAPEASEDVI